MALTLQDVLDLTEKWETTKEYKFIEQESINSKPSILASGENLRRFQLKIKLHSKFCDVATTIKEVEDQASKKESFSYFLKDEYIGEFVIERINKNIVQMFNDSIIYAEVDVDLLEIPNINTEYKNQTKINIVSNTGVLDGNSTSFKSYMQKIKNEIKTNMINSVIQNNTNNDLSNIGNELLSGIKSQIASDIDDMGVTKINEIVSNYTDKLTVSSSLSSKEIEIIKGELEQIGNNMINNALRQV